MSTIKEVAVLAGVSTATVSNVLNNRLPVSNRLKDRVLKAVAQLDYQPDYLAQGLRARQTRTLGIVIPDITNPFFPRLVRGAETAALDRKYVLITLNTDDDAEREKRVLTLLQRRRVDGVLLVLAANSTSLAHVRELPARGIPVVSIDRQQPRLKLDSITFDNAKGARDCVRHLLESGCRLVATISGPLTLHNARLRLAGYREALEERGVPFRRELVLEGNFREDGGYDAGLRLLKLQPRPDAVFVANGLMTMGLLTALHRNGQECPRDLAVACFDDLDLSEAFRPSLTGVTMAAFDLGRKGAELLIDRIEGRVKSEARVEIALKLTFHARESSRVAIGAAGSSV